MQELKKIILQRIQNIFELQELIINDQKGQLNSQTKYQTMIEQKKAEKIRTIKENEILLSLNSSSLEQNSRAEELYQATVQICSLYDEEFAKYRDLFTISMKENIRKIFCDFFNSHGFRHKTKHVNQAFQKPFSAISPAMLFGWLSQWSKKLYCQMLQKQIQITFQSREIKQRGIKITHTSAIQDRKKSFGVIEIPQNNQFPDFALNSRTNIYGFIHQQLINYYKFLNLEGIDYSYLKTIKKRFKKGEILKPSFLNKACQTIIDLPGQRQISKLMKQYEENYYLKFPKAKKSEYKGKSQTPLKKPTNIEKKKQRNSTETELDMNFNGSKLLAPKFSEFQFFKPDQIELKIKKLKFINNRSSKNNFQFPQIRRNSQQIYHKLNLSNPQIVFEQIDRQKTREKLSVSCLEKKLKDRIFLRCEGINSKMSLKQDVQNFQDMIFGERVDSPIKIKKNMNDTMDRDFDDRKLKQTKNFDLGDLKIHHRIPSIKAKFRGKHKN